MSKTVIDVGASVGLFATYIAKLSQNIDRKHSIEVIAVEPIMEIASLIPQMPNLKVVNKAICASELIPTSGRRLLKRMLNSELSTFSQLNANIDAKLWKWHIPFLTVLNEIEVECCTLESLFTDLDISTVDFLKIDTQGNDLEVFLSAGRYLPKIKAAVLEFPYTQQAAIYERETDLTSAIEQLSKENFFPVRIIPNGGGECNIFIRNGDFMIESYFNLELELGFEFAPTLKIGKHDPHINMGTMDKLVLKLKMFIKESLIH